MTKTEVLKLRDQAWGALIRMVKAVEDEDELLSNSGGVWNAYAQAREVLGDPPKDYPGGHYEFHFHKFGWQESDGCDACEDWQDEQEKPQ